MKFKRLISGAAAVALAVSSLSFSAFANPNAKPLEVGFETGQERNDSDEFDFLDKPYSLTSGDYYMGLSVQTGSWTHRNAIGVADSTSGTGHDAKNVNGDKITGINSYCSWSHLYGGGYASITKDANGVELKAPVSIYGPTGIFYGENEGENGIKEYAQLHDAKIGNNGTYTIGISGFNFKADTANNKDSDNGNGINIMYITSNIKYLEKNGVKIKNPVLKLYNTKEQYTSKKPYKSISAGYWLESPGDNDTGYTQYIFTNLWTKNNSDNPELGKVVSFDKKYENHDGSLDVFGISGFTGSKDSSFTKTGYSGCTFLPEYAMEITFEVDAPDSMMHKITSGKSLGNVVDEVGSILNNQAELEAIQKKNPSLTVEQIKEKLTSVYTAGKSAYDKYGNYKSLSKSLITEPRAAVDKALADIKAVCSELGILIWGEANGYVETAEAMDFTKYTSDTWKAVEDAIADVKALRAKYESGEAVTQAQIDAVALKLKNAIDALKEVKEKVDSSSGLGYIQFKDSTGKYQWYNDGKNYQNVTAKTVDVVTSDKGNGKTYTVKAKCDGTAKGLADANIEIQGLIKKQDTATVTIDEVKLDGKKQKLTGVPYTLAVDKANAYVPLYSADVTSIPDDAYTSPDGECAKDASPQALSQGAKKDYAALDTEWKEITVKFTVNWDDGLKEEEEPNENNSENPSTAGGVAVAASLVALLGAGYVVSRKRTK